MTSSAGDPRPEPGGSAEPTPRESTARAALKYTLLRIATFVAVVAVLYAVGLRGFTLVLAALVLSGVVSYVVLARQRAAFARRISQQVEERRAERARRDAELDAQHHDGSGTL